jgi:tetratricopeptide (TPR) repeat protein
VLSAKVLPRDVIAELSTLNERIGPKVQAHLSAAYVLLGTDPEEALRHALEARRIAPRLAIVREAVGIAYYHAARYGEAMKELRAARRIGGRDDSLPLIADCERALGRPEKALEIARDAVGLEGDTQVEMRIVAAGARMDMGQPEAAALTLQTKLLSSRRVSPSSARIKYAYADALLAAGREDEAILWFGRAAEADEDQVTDAADRLAHFEGVSFLSDPIDGAPPLGQGDG